MTPRFVRQFKQNAVCFRREYIEKLAGDSRAFRSPFVSLCAPLAYGKKLDCIVVRRAHLAAAMAAPDVRHVEYDFKLGQLVVTGPRTRYALVDLMRASNRYAIRRALAEWAEGVRKKRQRRSIPKDVRHEEKIHKAIAVQQRKLAKIYLHRPVNCLCVAPARYDGKYLRAVESTWAARKHIRQALAKLAAPYVQFRKRPKWTAFYSDAESIIGHPIDASNRHDRVTRQRHFQGDVFSYLAHLPRHIDGQQKPWRDRHEFNLEALQEARREYLSAAREAAAIREQIRALESLAGERR